MMKQYLRQLPAVHELQQSERFQTIASAYSVRMELVTSVIQKQLQAIRTAMLAGTWDRECVTKEKLTDTLLMLAEEEVRRTAVPYLKRVINATGTVLHTNLGRARLSDAAIRHMTEIASSYSNVEYDLQTGKRGSRHDIVERLLCEATGAEAAMVVNNNAAAVYLILRAFAKGKEVIVSRGQLVEIGGSFRVSSIMEESGAVLKEIGTTNKTHLYDYEQAIGERTAMMMKVHTSNFKVIGFTKTVETKELIALRQKYDDILYYEDLGSGDLLGYERFGIGDEPVVRDVIEAGADLVSFSGDKLLGGPQAGIIAGERKLIEQLKRHQLARVLRVDKVTLAALEATLAAYVKGDERSIPAVRDILEDEEHIFNRAQQFTALVQHLPLICTVRKDTSMIGGGTMPDVQLPTYVAEISHADKNAARLAGELRAAAPPVICRVQHEKLLIDFRTVASDEIGDIVQALQRVLETF